nr:uncharacterized protein LOC110088938 [Pogona vitticeps]
MARSNRHVRTFLSQIFSDKNYEQKVVETWDTLETHWLKSPPPGSFPAHFVNPLPRLASPSCLVGTSSFVTEAPRVQAGRDGKRSPGPVPAAPACLEPRRGSSLSFGALPPSTARNSEPRSQAGAARPPNSRWGKEVPALGAQQSLLLARNFSAGEGGRDGRRVPGFSRALVGHVDMATGDRSPGVSVFFGCRRRVGLLLLAATAGLCSGVWAVKNPSCHEVRTAFQIRQIGPLKLVPDVPTTETPIMKG